MKESKPLQVASENYLPVKYLLSYFKAAELFWLEMPHYLRFFSKLSQPEYHTRVL